jgi:predicted kinase
MTTTSKIHPFAEWAKSRLDEMDAALAVIETKAKDVEDGTRKKADTAIANMKKHRDVFKARIKTERDSDVKAWGEANAQLEAEWHGFEKNVETYWDSVGDKAGAYSDAFKAQADAQQKAWKNTATRVKAASEKFQTDSKADVAAAVAKAEQISHDAGVKLGNLNSAGKTSWGAMRSALTESREAFDVANSKVQAAFRGAVKKEETA